MNISNLNTLESAEAFKKFESCCVSVEWANAMVAARPFINLEQLHSKSNLIWSSLSDSDYLQAFEGHPRIGDVTTLRAKYAITAGSASHEQAGMSSAQESIIQEMAELNDGYFEKFGFIFIVCASGKSASEMLDLLKQRLPNDTKTELSLAAAEQAKITQIRLDKLLL